MVPLEEARNYVLGSHEALTPVSIPVREAVGTVLAQDVESAEAIPPFANTAMDGFAVQAADTAGANATPVTLDIVGTIAAGANPDLVVGPGQAARIMTGAPMPTGADAVVMVERTEASADGERVTIDLEVAHANHVRPVGDDVNVGDRVFAGGTPITPGHLGVLLSLGLTDVLVTPRPKVGVISTGDELIEGAQKLEPGQIRDSNRGTLLALVAEMGAEPIDLGLIRDDEDAIEAGLLAGADSCDALITSGGVSMGDFDFVKSVLSRLADMRWMQVAIRPAKPLAYGLLDSTPVFGLPGNPVSSMVSFELFARPALRTMAGFADRERLRVRAVATEALDRRSDGKTHFARVRWAYERGEFRIASAGGQGSHQLSAMADANGLAVLPDGNGVAPGDTVELIVLND